MRILMWSFHYLPLLGGIEIMLHSLALWLKAMGHEVEVISNKLSDALVIEQNEAVTVHRFAFEQALQSQNLKLIHEIITNTNTIIEQFKPDLIHYHTWSEPLAFFQIRVQRCYPQIPSVLTIHGVLEGDKTGDGLNFQLLLKKINKIICVSDSLIQAMLEKNPALFSDLLMIHNGITWRAVNKIMLKSEPLQLLIISRLSEEKGVEVAIKAMKIILDKKLAVQLTIGGYGPMYQEFERLIDALALNNNVKLIGRVPPEQVFDVMAKAHIILVPSTYEAFGLVAAEAGWVGKPVIASRVGGLAEVIEHGKTGLLVEPGNSEALAKAIIEFVNQPELIKQMGARAKARIVENFSIDKMGRQYLALYHELQPIETCTDVN